MRDERQPHEAVLFAAAHANIDWSQFVVIFPVDHNPLGFSIPPRQTSLALAPFHRLLSYPCQNHNAAIRGDDPRVKNADDLQILLRWLQV